MVIEYNRFAKLYLLIGICFLLTGCATTVPDVQTMLVNLSHSYPNLWKMLTAVSYVLGFGLFMKALYNLKIYGEQRSMMSTQGSLKTPIAYVFAGSMLIWSPTGFSVLNQTLFGQGNPLDYGGAISGWSVVSTKAFLGAIQLIGLIAFIRGLVYVARAGDMNAQPGTFVKALTHLLGGVLAINIAGTIRVVESTLGFGFS